MQGGGALPGTGGPVHGPSPMAPPLPRATMSAHPEPPDESPGESPGDGAPGTPAWLIPPADNPWGEPPRPPKRQRIPANPWGEPAARSKGEAGPLPFPLAPPPERPAWTPPSSGANPWAEAAPRPSEPAGTGTAQPLAAETSGPRAPTAAPQAGAATPETEHFGDSTDRSGTPNLDPDDTGTARSADSTSQEAASPGAPEQALPLQQAGPPGPLQDGPEQVTGGPAKRPRKAPTAAPEAAGPGGRPPAPTPSDGPRPANPWLEEADRPAERTSDPTRNTPGTAQSHAPETQAAAAELRTSAPERPRPLHKPQGDTEGDDSADEAASGRASASIGPEADAQADRLPNGGRGRVGAFARMPRADEPASDTRGGDAADDGSGDDAASGDALTGVGSEVDAQAGGSTDGGRGRAGASLQGLWAGGPVSDVRGGDAADDGSGDDAASARVPRPGGLARKAQADGAVGDALSGPVVQFGGPEPDVRAGAAAGDNGAGDAGSGRAL